MLVLTIDVLEQPSMPRPSRRASSEGQRSVSAARRLFGDPYLIPHHGQHPTASDRDRGPDLPPLTQHPAHSSRSHSYPSASSSSSAYAYASTSQAQPAGHSYHLFNYSPNQGLVHQRSSARDDLDPTMPKPRLPPSDPARRYVCAECGNRFSKQSTLRNHLLTHSGERPFACTHPGCGRRFSMACNMQRHMRTHTSASAFLIDSADDGDRDIPSGWTTQVSSRGGSSRGGSSREGSSRGGSPRDDTWSSSNRHTGKY